MQVQMRQRADIESGAVTVLFRRWKRPQAKTGNVYRTAAGRLLVTAVTVVDPAGISDADAGRAGFADGDAARAALRGDASLPVYRIVVEPASGPDPRSELAADDALDTDAVTEIDRRLDRLDRASSHGAWTMATIRLIEKHPATLAADLAAMVGRERDPFKLDVRKLKGLGLTESLKVGYRLSPRGAAWLAATQRPS